MNNKMQEKEILNLIKSEDRQYILNLETKNNCKYEFNILKYHLQESDFVQELAWDIPNDNYYAILGKPINDYFLENEDRIAGFELNYLVGVNNESVIIVPHQGGMDAYKIKNNKVDQVYPYKNSNSHNWR